MEQINQFIAEKFYYLFLGTLAVYIIMRMKNPNSSKKRQVVFYLAIGVFLLYTSAILPIQDLVPQWFTIVVAIAVVAGETYILRRNWFFKRKCVVCDTTLDWNTTLMDDRNTCADCLAKEEETEKVIAQGESTKDDSDTEEHSPEEENSEVTDEEK